MFTNSKWPLWFDYTKVGLNSSHIGFEEHMPLCGVELTHWGIKACPKKLIIFYKHFMITFISFKKGDISRYHSQPDHFDVYLSNIIYLKRKYYFCAMNKTFCSLPYSFGGLNRTSYFHNLILFYGGILI